MGYETARADGTRDLAAQGIDPCQDGPGPSETATLLATIALLAQANGFDVYQGLRLPTFDARFPVVMLCNGVSLLIYVLMAEGQVLPKDLALGLTQLVHTEKVECGIWRCSDLPIIVQRLTREAR